MDPDDFVETECEECGAEITIPPWATRVCLGCEYGEYNRLAAERTEDESEWEGAPEDGGEQ